MIFLPWLKQNLKLVLSSAVISFVSASVSGVSLVLVQGVFGKEKQGSTTDVARKAIDFLGAERAILLAIAIWGFSTYFLNNFNERLTARRLQKRRATRRGESGRIDAQERQFLVNESHFFESVIGFINHIIRTVVFALTLLAVSPNLIRIDVLISLIYLVVICRQRFEKGLHVSREGRAHRRERQIKRQGKDFSPEFDVFIKRSWLSAKLDNRHLLVFVALIIAPFIISDIFSLKILDKMVLFNFSTLLIFFSSAIHLAIQSAGIGFRFNTVFSGDEIEESDEV